MIQALILALVSTTPPPASTSHFSFEGVTEPIAQAVVSATVPGKIDQIPVSEGQQVRKGDTLLTLERETEEINVRMTRLLADSKAELDAAQVKVEIYGKDYKATKGLFDSSNSVSEEQVWEKDLQWRLARADHDKFTAQKGKEELENQLAAAELSRRVIRAPFNGVVVKIHKRLAESVQALEPLVEVVDVRRCRFVGHVPAPEAQGIRKGQDLQLKLDGSKEPRSRTGKVEFISPTVDQASLLRTVKVVFENTDGSIEPGVSGRIVPPSH